MTLQSFAVTVLLLVAAYAVNYWTWYECLRSQRARRRLAALERTLRRREEPQE